MNNTTINKISATSQKPLKNPTKKEREVILKVQNLIIEFGTGRKKVKAVKNASFNIYKNETFGLVGESGSGKTTIGKAIMGIQPVNDGAIYFKDKLIYGESPNLFAMNSKLARLLDLMVINHNTTTSCLNDYLFEFKRVFYKYSQSKFFVFKTRELRNYPDGRSRIISEGTNLIDTKIIRSKKDANLTIVSEAIKDSLKNLLKILRLNQQTLFFSKKLDKYTSINAEAVKYLYECQQNISDLISEIKQIENDMFLLVKKMQNIRKDILKGKMFSIKLYFESMGEKLKSVIALQKKVRPLLDVVVDYQVSCLFLTSSIKKKNQFLQRLMEQQKISEINENISEIKRLQKIIDIGKDLDFQKIIKETPRFRIPTKVEKYNLKKEMQMIFQDPSSSLNDRMAVEEIIGEGLNNFPDIYKNEEAFKTYVTWWNSNHDENHKITIEDVKPNDVKRFLILNLLTTVGMLPEHLSRYPHEFSGGQRQRIGIARALIMKPSFIVADEPISALDVSIRAQVMNLLAKFKQEFDLTYIFIAHDLSIVKFVANRIAVIYRGDIVELAESEELFKNPLHPYTRSLLSSIPEPDFNEENKKTTFRYYPEKEHHDYLLDFPKWQEISRKHFVYANDREAKKYRSILEKKEK